MEILLVLLLGAGVLYYLYKKMNQPENMNSLHDHSVTPTVPPMPEPQPVLEVPTITSASQLPEGWNSYTPAEKIAFFNANGVTEKQLLAHGVTADEIVWMRANGYIVGLHTVENNTVTTEVKKAVQKTRARVKKAADLDGDGRVTLKDVKVAAGRASKTAAAVADKAAKAANTAKKAATKSRTKK